MNSLPTRIYILLLLLHAFLDGFSQTSCKEYEAQIDASLSAELNLAEAEQLFDAYTSKDCADMLLAYNFMGFIHYNLSNLDKAKEYLLLGEKAYFATETNPEQYAVNQSYSALILIVKKDYESALYHLNKAETYAKKSSDKFIKSSVYQNIGMLKVQMGALEEGERYLNKAIKNGGLDSISIGYIYQNLALLHLKSGNSTKTQEFIGKTDHIWKTQSYLKGVYQLSFIEAQFAIENEAYADALSFIKKGRAAYQNKEKLLLGENYLIEAQAHEKLGNAEARRAALEYAIIESDDLSEKQLEQALMDISTLEDQAATNIILSELISKLKTKNKNQKKNSTSLNKIMDSKMAKDESLIRKQVGFIGLLSILLFLVILLLVRIKNQKTNILSLNKSLESAKKEVEKQLKTVKRNNKDLEQFAYVASHDLQAPLRIISSFSGILKKRENTVEETNEYLDLIASSAKNMTAMISDLLKFSTLDQKLTIGTVNFKDLVTISLQRLHVQIKESGASIHMEESCDQAIQCDKNLFANVIQNLITNGITYCKDGEQPAIAISTLKKKETIEIRIADNGIGIDEDYKEEVFEMFRRLKVKKVDGTGIGLASCKKIVENHNGSINVESKLGAGSTFVIVLPIVAVGDR